MASSRRHMSVSCAICALPDQLCVANMPQLSGAVVHTESPVRLVRMGVLTIGNDRAIASADAAACALLTSDDLVGRVLTEVVVPVEAQRSPHQLSYLVHRAVALLRRRPAPTPRFVLRGIGAAHTAVVVDHLQAEQVLVNLFENALDAARDEVIVRVLEGASPAQAVCIEVADDGDGVPPEMARKIFDPFFTTKAHGTGLGLAIARDLTRLNGGDLRLVPRSGGAVFHLLFSSTLAPIRAEW
jgi:light-regulated signal transduction histidine kinase (bacteriophytochrome)